MSVDILIGLQWGDEGKGKLVDLISDRYDAIARYQGGDNAGHTVVHGDLTLKFHLIPSGISSKGKIVVMGHGMVVNLATLVKELETLKSYGISTKGLRISDRAFVILPLHKRIDAERESGDSPIGTTGRGIGPAYQDKYSRSGIRIGDFFEKDIEKRLADKELNSSEIEEQMNLFEVIKDYVCNTIELLQSIEEKGSRILLEGAQGIMLDIDFGTYPYVTSSSPNSGGGLMGTGLRVRSVDKLIGVMKAYTTRVGRGPFPTELLDETGEKIRNNGKEFGTTTGRPRRCGWLDFAQLRYATRVCDTSELAIMKLDVLTGLDKIKFVKGYSLDGKKLDGYPSRTSQLERVETEWGEVKGWKKSIVGCRKYEELPDEAKEYLALIESELKIPIRYVSTSPDQKDTIEIR